MNTKQFEFDAVVDHLFKQGKPSILPNAPGTKTSCAYRGENGTMCAVGCRIPNNMYHPDMEGKKVIGLLIDPDKFPSLPVELSEYSSMFQMLQDAHDTFTYMSERHAWAQWLNIKLSEIAKLEGLTFKARV